jgi:uncharacterized protein YjbI with pentapeptide repeats
VPSSSSKDHSVAQSFLCECELWMRPACIGLPFYGESTGKKLCVLHIPAHSKVHDFNKVIADKLRDGDGHFQGVQFPDHLTAKGHNFGDGADFTGTHFSRGADFSDAIFSGTVSFKNTVFGNGAGVGFSRAVFQGDADFSSTRFTLGASFKQAQFKGKAKFKGVAFNFGAIFESTSFGDVTDFSEAVFPGNAFFMYAQFYKQAYFNQSVFNEEGNFEYASFHSAAYFLRTSFKKKIDFTSVTFESDVEFNKTAFHSEVVFADAIFKGYSGFWGYGKDRVFSENSSVKFQYARIEEPHNFYFHTLTLRPHWFINVDVRQFDFANVEWNAELKDEIKSLKESETLEPHRLLAITCRHLAVNAEENHRYDEASRFRYLAMDARRREKYRGLTPWKLGWWYWLASGYGERIVRASAVLLVIWILFAALYTRVGFMRWEPRLTSESDVASARYDETGQPLTSFKKALAYSASVITLQKPDPRPATNWAKGLVISETILGPLQAALLALTIRRKFMR